MWGDQIWLTTAIRESPPRLKRAKRRLESNTGDQPLVVLSSVSLRAVCVDRNSGKILHDIELLNVKDPQWAHQLNSYASPSPVLDDGRLYAHFGSFGTVALDTKTLKVLWKNEELNVMHENGPGSTAVLHGDRLIAHFDGSDQQFIAAFDKNTGKLAWKTPRSGEMDPRPQQRKAYGTPLVVTINGQPQVVSSAANNIYGYDPQTGQELWKVHYGELGFSMSTVPVADDQQIYFSTAFGKSAVIALKHAGLKTPEVAWRNNKNAPKMCSPVLHDGLLFYVDDGGIVSCVDTKPAKRSTANESAANSAPHRSLLTANSTSPAAKASSRSSTRPRNSKSSPRTRSTARSWPAPSPTAAPCFSAPTRRFTRSGSEEPAPRLRHSKRRISFCHDDSGSN
jgi:outer membrane protein assembly factor BamB